MTMNKNTHLAIDIGASSGRHILGWLEDGRIHLKEVHRFPNGMKQTDGCLCWDVDAIFSEILTGLKKCAHLGKIPVSVGVDTWGVDYVLVDSEGNRIGPAVAYRDSRTEGMDLEVDKCIPEAELYSHAGIQKMMFNTIYQLMALKNKTPNLMNEAARLLLMPDYLHYRLCGVLKTEYSIASTTGLLGASSKTWDDEIIARCGFPRQLFGEIVPPGTILGGLTDDVRQAIGFDCDVALPPTHDTGSAFLAVPSKSDNSVFISSGTWSLMGVELSSPITTENSRISGLTNEGGYQYRYRYLKNIMGLWILQSIHREIGEGISFADLVSLTRVSDYDGIIDVDEDRFFAPASMVTAVRDACVEGGYAGSQSIGDMARCVCRSLALSYAKTVKELQTLTGKRFDSINIIGGGSENAYLNEVTAQTCALPVYAGPAEGTALGNIVSQMISYGEFPNLEDARNAIRRSFNIREVLP